MTTITVTEAQVGLVDPQKALVKTYIAAEAIDAGEAIFLNTSGKAELADGNAAGEYQFRGIALNSVGAGQAVDVVEEGEVYGFSLDGNYDTLAYVNDTPGVIGDAAGTVTIPVGRVAPLADKDLTKVLRVFVHRDADWS